MSFAATREALTESVVAVPTTIWKAAGELDVEANAKNAEYIFGKGMTAAVYAGGGGEHDRLSVEEQKELLAAVSAAARGKADNPCVGTGLGRTVERVKELAPTLGELEIAFAMMMPPDIDDQDEQYDYYSEVMTILTEHGVGPMIYARPEHPMTPGLIERLFDAFEVPGVKLAHNGLLLAYAEMVERLGQERSAWLCGTAGWWIPAYKAVGAAWGMSTGIGNAFPDKALNLLGRVNNGSFEPDGDYWTMVRIEQIRQRDKANIALVIKHMQTMVGLSGGMNGDGGELPDAIKAEVDELVENACWLSRG